MKTVQYSVKYVEKASRWEVLIRIPWAIPTAIVMIVLLIIGTIAALLQIVHVLILGKRHKVLHGWIFKFMAYLVKYSSYKNLLTDERNPIMPED